MVEGGDNESFDTSVLDDEFLISSGSDPSQPTGSQPFSIGGSQPFSIGGSQDDNIESFLTKAEQDEQVLLRSPFRPSVPQSVRHASRENMRHRYRSPEPEFLMPRVEVEGPRRDSVHSSSTVRAAPPSLPGLRRRQLDGSARSAPGRAPRSSDAPPSRRQPSSQQPPLLEPLGDVLSSSVSWSLGVLGLALRYAQKPIAFLVSIYLLIGVYMMVQNAAVRSLQVAVSPICHIPGVSWLNLPVCSGISAPDLNPPSVPLEFSGLMNVQDQLEEVLEKSAQGVSLPMEMKRSEAAIRDLRTLVRHSNLEGKEELVAEFDGFIDIARTASSNLQRFNSHVGSTVDQVISINLWTARYLDGLASEDKSRGLLGEWTDWLFGPFQPVVFSEHALFDKYIEHTALISDKIAVLITEAQTVLGTLFRAEDHLGIMHEFVSRSQKSVQSRRDDILWTLWSLVGANTRHLHNLDAQLRLLGQVGSQRKAAVTQVNDLVVELEKIQAALDDLRDRVAEPELVRGRVHIPLSVHVETINRGVERLEVARNRIRSVENERISEVLARGNIEDRMIGSA